MNDDNLKNEFEDELASIKETELFSETYRKKKLITYVVRTVITVVLYVTFWKYSWVKWSLFIYVPLNLFFLLSLFGWNFLLKRKIDRTKQKIDNLK